MKVGEVGEFGLLDALGVVRVPLPKGWLGPGDDAAILPAPSAPLLLTADLLCEGTHFRRSTTSAGDLGYKALAVNVSDVAAMGGTPLGFTLSLACPSDLDVDWLQELYGGLDEAAREFQCPLVGGDTSSAPLVFLSLALLGVAPPGGAVCRSGARPGDDLYVTGFPGESAAGLRLLEAGLSGEDGARGQVVARHRRPTPRTSLGAALGREQLPSAMIDVSDGLLQDLGHVLAQSGAGATVDWEALPISDALKEVATQVGLDPADLVLSGGEDYELLFTAPPERAPAVWAAARRCDTSLRRIGSVEAAPGLRLVRKGEGVTAPSHKGFDHFRGSGAP